jgi:hypothetical protein
MQTYFIQLEVDEKWLEAINKLTADIYEGEVCKWINIQAEEKEGEKES